MRSITQLTSINDELRRVRFWPVLYRAGFTERLLAPDEELTTRSGLRAFH